METKDAAELVTYALHLSWTSQFDFKLKKNSIMVQMEVKKSTRCVFYKALAVSIRLH